MNKLLPCPFCGGEAEADQTAERFEYGTGGPYSVMDYGYIVYCTKCDASMFERNVPPSTEEEAIREWNRRTPPTVPLEVHQAVVYGRQSAQITLNFLRHDLPSRFECDETRLDIAVLEKNIEAFDRAIAWLDAQGKD